MIHHRRCFLVGLLFCNRLQPESVRVPFIYYYYFRNSVCGCSNVAGKRIPPRYPCLSKVLAQSPEMTFGLWGLGVLLVIWVLRVGLRVAWSCGFSIFAFPSTRHRMLSLVDSTGRRTAAAALRNCVYLAPIGFLAVAGEPRTRAPWLMLNGKRQWYVAFV